MRGSASPERRKHIRAEMCIVYVSKVEGCKSKIEGREAERNFRTFEKPFQWRCEKNGRSEVEVEGWPRRQCVGIDTYIVDGGVEHSHEMGI